ncbi:MAG: hypothetical protein ACFFBD_23860, partial [Candidatus Hodarchaeota archaeon]
RKASEEQRVILEDMMFNIEKILQLFVSELELKRVVCQQLTQITSPKEYGLYLTLWISEPYLDYRLLEECLENIKSGQERLFQLENQFEEKLGNNCTDSKLNPSPPMQFQADKLSS